MAPECLFADPSVPRDVDERPLTWPLTPVVMSVVVIPLRACGSPRHTLHLPLTLSSFSGWADGSRSLWDIGWWRLGLAMWVREPGP